MIIIMNTINKEGVEVSKLVANIPTQLKEFVANASDNSDVSISTYITNLIKKEQEKVERLKAVAALEYFVKNNKMHSNKTSVELVREIRTNSD